jgi:hypothetical protein
MPSRWSYSFAFACRRGHSISRQLLPPQHLAARKTQSVHSPLKVPNLSLLWTLSESGQLDGIFWQSGELFRHPKSSYLVMPAVRFSASERLCRSLEEYKGRRVLELQASAQPLALAPAPGFLSSRLLLSLSPHNT